MEEKLEYRLTYLTETLEDMKREMIRIRTIMSNSRKTHYSSQEVMELLQITSATLKKWVFLLFDIMVLILIISLFISSSVSVRYVSLYSSFSSIVYSECLIDISFMS